MREYLSSSIEAAQLVFDGAKQLGRAAVVKAAVIIASVDERAANALNDPNEL